MFSIPSLFFIIALPAIFLLAVWVVVTSLRILFPEQAERLDENPWQLDEWFEPLEDTPMLVGVSEIREGQRRSQRRQATAPYSYERGGVPGGCPTTWRDDLWLRRN